MVLVYMLTFIGGYIDGIHVTIYYIAYMDPMGMKFPSDTMKLLMKFPEKHKKKWWDTLEDHSPYERAVFLEYSHQVWSNLAGWMVESRTEIN